jgi:hypothetical protein
MTPSKPLTVLALAGAIALSLLASACGGSARNGVAQVGSTPTTTSGANTGASHSRDDRNVLVAFAVCMRRHGLPSFPDPRADSDGYHLRYGAENGIDPRSSQFTNAQQGVPEAAAQRRPAELAGAREGAPGGPRVRRLHARARRGQLPRSKGLERRRQRNRHRREVTREPQLPQRQGR